MEIIVILMILYVYALVIRRAIQSKRVNAVLTSELGQRYIANLEATGRVTQTRNVSKLGSLVAEREAIVKSARAENIDLELVDALIRDAAKYRQRDGGNRNDAEAAAPRVESRIVAENLYLCGERASAALAASVCAIGKRTGMIVTADEAARLNFQHAHALVWFTIASHLPAEEGKPLMNAHIDVLLAHLVDGGVSVCRNELEASIRDQWMAYVRRPEAAGGQLFALASLILKSYAPSGRLGVDDALAVAEVIIGVVKDTRSFLVPVYAS